MLSTNQKVMIRTAMCRHLECALEKTQVPAFGLENDYGEGDRMSSWVPLFPALETALNDYMYAFDIPRQYDTPAAFSGNNLSFDDQYLTANQHLTTNQHIPNDVNLWSVVRQERPGTHHGMGGRPRLTSGRERRANVPTEVCQKLMVTLTSVSKSSRSELLLHIWDNISDSDRAAPIDISQSTANETFPWSLNNNMIFNLTAYKVLPGPYFAVCQNVGYSQFMRASGNVMERHAVYFWITKDGDLMCTCVGSTKFRIIQLSIREGSDIRDCNCIHTEGFKKFLLPLTELFQVSLKTVSTALHRFDCTLNNVNVSSFNFSLPKTIKVHKGKIMVMCGIICGEDIVQYTPVRALRGGMTYICAFCDTVHLGICHHSISVRRDPRAGNNFEQESFSENDDLGDNVLSVLPRIPSIGSETISFLPLSPVNCEKAIQADMKINLLALGND